MLRKKSSFIVVILLFSVFVTVNAVKSPISIENLLVVKEPVEQLQELGINAIYENTSETGQWDKSYGEQLKVVVKGTTAFLASRYDGLIALDISDPTNPVKIGQYTLPEDESCIYVDVDGNTAYLACNYYGLVSVNITDPTDMQFLDRIDIEGYSHQVIAESDIVYVAEGSKGLVIYDASNPADLTNISSIRSGTNIDQIFKYGDYILTETSSGSLFIILDVSVPSSPSEVATYSAFGYILNLIAVNNFAYLFQGSNLCEIVNITTIESPTWHSYSYLYLSAWYSDVDSNTLFIGGLFGFAIYDLTNPVSPALLSQHSYQNGNALSDVYVDGTNLIVSLRSMGLEIFDITNKNTPIKQGTFLNYGNFCDIYQEDDLAYVVSTYGFLILNVSDKENPQLINHTRIYTDNSLGQSIIVHEGIAYLVIKSYLYVFNVSNPMSPLLLNDSLNIYQAWDMDIRDNYLFLSGLYHLRIIDISDPTTPIFIKDANFPTTYFSDLALKGDFAYVASQSNGITILSIADIMNPFIFGTISPGGQVDCLKIVGDYLIGHADNFGVFIYNISSGSATLLDSVSLSGYSSIANLAIDDQYIYLAKDEYGIYIYDWSEPTNLVSVGHFYDDSGLAQNLKVENQTIFCADYNDGLEIVILDNDNDGLSNRDETDIYLTDPNDADTDTDGLSDYDELKVEGTDPLDADTDDDSLIDGDEITEGTDPFDSDSDDDGLTDGAEVHTHNTDPNDSDSDDDSILDSEEVIPGADGFITDPNSNDTDSDGLLDAYEITTSLTDPSLADSDGDGLDDPEELVSGLDGFITDPMDSDSDDDNLNDGDEYIEGTDPHNDDCDSDSLLDGDEVHTHLTDPLDADSDDDSLNDNVEVSLGTNPNLIDSDGDFLSDYDEVFDTGTDPLDSDSDDDGIDDFEETIAGTDGFVTDPNDADTDGDGIEDGAEVLAGTDPTDPNDPPPSDTSPVFGSLVSVLAFVSLSFVFIALLQRKRNH